MRAFSLAVYDVQPSTTRLDYVSINPDLTALKWSSQLPGGFNSIEIGTADVQGGAAGLLPNEIMARPFAHVQVFARSALCCEGRLIRAVKPGGKLRGLYTAGYGISAVQDGVYQSTDSTTRTSGQCLASIIASAAPLLQVGNQDQFIDPGVAHALSDFNNQTPAQVIQQLIAEGGNANATWDYAVWENRTLSFLPRVAPNPPQYHIPFDSTVSWQEDYTNLYGNVLLNYQSTTTGAAATVQPVPNVPFANIYGFSRTAFVNGSNMTDSGAASYVNSFVALSSAPVYPVTVTRDDSRGMELYGGGERPAWLVRAGEWVQIGNQSPLPIIRAQYDAFGGTLQLDLGAPSPTIPTLLQALRLSTAQLAASINVKTGAKAY